MGDGEATPTDATPTGPPPARRPSDGETQPCDVEAQEIDGDADDGEGQPLLNTASDSSSPSNAQRNTVSVEEPGDSAESTPATSLASSSDSEAGDVVSVPLAQFQQLVELLAEALREIKSTKQVQSDLEQGSTDVVRKRGMHNKCYSFCNFPHDQYSQEEGMRHREEAIDKIWNSVEPWDMSCLSEIPDEPLGYPGLDIYRRYDHSVYDERKYKHWGHERSILIAKKMLTCGLINRVRESKILDMGQLLSSSLASILSGDKYLLGDILFDCYQSKALNRQTGLRSEHNDCENIVAIVTVLLINDERFTNIDMLKYERAERIFNTKPLDIVLGMDIGSIFQILHLSSQKPSALEGSKGSTLAVSDLNIKALKSIGGLSIKWTSSFEDHLQLDLPSKTLYVAWVLVGLGPRGAMNYFQLRDTMVSWAQEKSTLNNELIKSWAMLFATSRRHKDRVSEYDKLQKPIWHLSDGIRTYYDGHPNSYAEIQSYHLRDGGNVYDNGYRRIQRAVFDKTPIYFAEFPLLEPRLRQLRHYMDNQKPRGLRQLWRDNRDSLNYYTFWMVVTFGVVSLTLATGSLAVSAAQTWASFRALDMASSPSDSSP